MNDELIDLKAFWDRDGDGALVYRATAFSESMGREPLFEMTVTFSSSARHHLSDEVCRSIARKLNCEEMRQALEQVESLTDLQHG
ncbi:MAG: hypothetical protein BWY77_00073 [bacterium ADurb.Bin431]|nr:MAG: hypothetical protein BWY77_00073 [bacterium ADurb.Bin431]HNY89964.1 hypothetical protein [bacterium]HOH07025.1 hypothetical protein [bacterium]HOY43625.1 hypothetical protein [bacterium]HPG81847.1 hypothetical protein [bacterium]